MANELTVSLNIAFDKNATKATKIQSGKKFTVSGNKFASIIQGIGTAAEQINKGDVAAANLGFCYFFNMDAANTIHIRPGAAGADFLDIKAQEFIWVRITPSVDLYAIADNAEALLEGLIFNN